MKKIRCSILTRIMVFVLVPGGLAMAGESPVPPVKPIAAVETKTKQAPPLVLDKIQVVVNNEVITQSDLDQRIDITLMQLQTTKANIPTKAVLRKQVLQQMIDVYLQRQVADKFNITIDNDTLNKAIGRVAAQNKMTLTQLRQALAQHHIPYQAFRNMVRDELKISRAQMREVKPRVTVTQQEVDNFLAAFKQIEQKELSYRVKDIVISVPDSPSPDEIAKTQAKAQALVEQLNKGADFDMISAQESDSGQALKGGDLGWRNLARLPTVFAEKIPAMQKGDIAGPIRTSNGFHIIKLVDIQGNPNTHVITQTKARHILIKTNALVTDEVAQSKLKTIRAQIEKGRSFADLARQYSDDPGSAGEGGELGWTTDDALVPAFAKAMDKLAVHQLSQPVKSQFGWHLIEVQARRKKDMTAQYERDHIQQMIGQRKYEEAIVNWISQLRNGAYIKQY